VLGMALAPTNSFGSTYLFYATGNTGGSSTAPSFNAINLSNNTNALITPTTNGTNGFLPYGLAYDPSNGNIYGVGNVTSTYYIFELTPTYSSGTLTGLGYTQLDSVTGSDTIGGGTGSLNNPVGVAFGPDGNLYIGEASSDEVDVINIDGNGTPALSGVLDKYISTSSTTIWGIGFTPTPEPASLSLLSLAAGALLLRRRRTR
jgi:hypothetical protein